MKYFKKIEGERIYLFPIHLDDAELYVKWMNDRSVTDGTHAGARVTNIIGEQSWIQGTLERGDYTFGIILKDSDQLIGNCGIMNVNVIDGTAELGIFIGEEKYRGKGYSSEALRLLLDYGFQQLRLHNICLKVFDFNKKAIQCYQKTGFKEFGRRHECYYLDGKYYDEIFMEILEDEYRK